MLKTAVGISKILWTGTCAVILFSACQPSLEHQNKIGILEEPRTFVEGTQTYDPFPSAKPKLTRELVARGQERYQIYCSVCHGITGNGDGMATTRGFGSSGRLHLKGKNIDSIEGIIASGQGRMMGFSDRIPFDDRYAIAAYTEVLDLRANFPVAKLSAEDRAHLEGGPK